MPDVIRDIARTIDLLAKRVRKLETTTSRERKYIVNVRDYGAFGDGVTDDTAAIQAAIDSVGATTYYCNIELYFPAGTYYVTSSIDLTDKRNILIRGDSGGFDGYAASKILSRANGKPALDMSGSANIAISHITIYGDNTNSPSCGVLMARTTAGTGELSAYNTFRNVFIGGYYTISALYSWSSELNKYDKCWFENLDTSGKCAVFIGGRNRYSITSDYVTFSATVSSAVGKLSDCNMTLYNATTPDAILVIGDSVGNFSFSGGYAQSDIACPTVEVQGTQWYTEFIDWYVEHANCTIGFSFTLYSGAGVVKDFIIRGGSASLVCTSYFIDQVASHTINNLFLDNIHSHNGSSASTIRFQGTVNEADIRRWWLFDAGTITFNILYNSEVWYHGHTLTITTILNSRIIRQDVNNPNHWYGSKSLQVGTDTNRTDGVLSTISSIITGSSTWDIGSLDDGQTASTYITTTGSASNDGKWVCFASHTSITDGGWQISAYPMGGYVRVTVTNHTGGTVDLATGTLRIVAMKVA